MENSCLLKSGKQKAFKTHFVFDIEMTWYNIEQKCCDSKQKWSNLEHEWGNLEQMWFRAKNSVSHD